MKGSDARQRQLLGCPPHPPVHAHMNTRTHAHMHIHTHAHVLLQRLPCLPTSAPWGENGSKNGEKACLTTGSCVIHFSLDRTPFPCPHCLGGILSPVCSPGLWALLLSIISISQLPHSFAGWRFSRKQ